MEASELPDYTKIFENHDVKALINLSYPHPTSVPITIESLLACCDNEKAKENLKNKLLNWWKSGSGDIITDSDIACQPEDLFWIIELAPNCKDDYNKLTRRIFKGCRVALLTKLIAYEELNIDRDEVLSLSNDELLNRIIESLREKRKEVASFDIRTLPDESEITKGKYKRFKKNHPTATIMDFNEYRKNRIIKLIRYLPNFIEKLDRELDYSILDDINLEKLALLICYESFVAGNIKDETVGDLLNDGYSTLLAINSLRGQEDKSCRIRYINISGLDTTVTASLLNEIYTKFINSLPPDKTLNGKIDYAGSYQGAKDAMGQAYEQRLAEIAREEEIARRKALIAETALNWEVIPEGEKIESITNGTQSLRMKTRKSSEELRLEQESANALLEEKLACFDSTGYDIKLRGKDKFSGYVGYVYPNGKVIFERFYLDEGRNIPATGQAIYVMSVNNFIELSQLSKPEILERINSTENSNVKRIYHTKKRLNVPTWQDRVQREINSTGYTTDHLDTLRILGEQLGSVKSLDGDSSAKCRALGAVPTTSAGK